MTMMMMTQAEPDDSRAGTGGFEVHLDVFEGPFDLLLGLICLYHISTAKCNEEQ